ncbi:MAG: PAS domain S-box protein [Sphingomonas sp.]|nr:PAS domain S-box protein [Sphingomonas sp.]
MTMTTTSDLARLFFENHPDPMGIFDVETDTLIDANAAAARAYGYSLEELRGLPIARLRVSREPERAEAGAEETFHAVHRRKDGSTFHVYVRTYATDINGRRCLIAIARDVTEERRQERLARHLTRINSIAGRMARLGGWTVSPEGEVVWTPEAAEVFGFTAETMPDLASGFDRVVPQHRARISEAFRRCLTQGIGFDTVCQIDTPTRGRIWVHIIGEVERDADGRILHCLGASQDVTELFTAREESARRGEQLFAVINSLADPFCILDTTGRLSFCNQAATELIARPPETVTGAYFWDICPFPGEAIATHSARNAVRERRAVSVELHHPGLQRWYRFNLYPTGYGMLLHLNDITDQRAKEEQTRLLRTAVDRANDFVFILSRDFDAASGGRKVLYANQTYLTATGFSPEEVIGKTPLALYDQRNDPALIEQIQQAAARDEAVRCDLWMRRKDGGEILVETDASIIRTAEGEVASWLVILRPVSEQRRVEAQLRLNTERLRLISRATSDVIWDYDVAQGRIWWNENLRTLLGYDPATFDPSVEGWANIVVAEDRERVRAAFDAALAGSDPVFRADYRLKRADGSIAHILDRGFVLRDEAGRATRAIGSMVDVSQQRELDEQLRQAQKLEAVGQLTGGLAHDFNNLLTVILGNAEAMTQIASDDPDLNILAQMTMKAAERGAELTNRLLAFGRRQTLAPRDLDSNLLVQGMAALLRRTLPETVEIELHATAPVWPARVDPGQLEVALLNLALNARDAMPSGGKLTIGTANITLDSPIGEQADGIAPGQYVAVSVTDTGTGMTREVRQRAFDPFFTTKEVGKGSGLGLSMVYGFARQSGGAVTIDTALGHGTTVTLYLPRAPGEVVAAPRPRALPEAPTGTETVLVVEDDALVRNHVCALLRGLGYTVLTAADGREALRLIQCDTPIDLLFTDIVMPGGVDGNALAELARELRPDLRLLFTTGYAEDRPIGGGDGRRPARVVQKPYRRAELAAKIRAALDAPVPAMA